MGVKVTPLAPAGKARPRLAASGGATGAVSEAGTGWGSESRLLDAAAPRGGPGTALGPGAGHDGLGPQLGTQGAAGWVVRRPVPAGLWGGWGWVGRRGGRLTAPTQLSVRSELRP